MTDNATATDFICIDCQLLLIDNEAGDDVGVVLVASLGFCKGLSIEGSSEASRLG